MTPKELIQRRLANHSVSSLLFENSSEVVFHFGAMQAQDYNMSKWAVGIRTKATTDLEVEQSINEGEILRTHILRPTWHLVHRNDIRWMMELSAPYVKKFTQYMDRQEGLTEEVFKKAWKIIEGEFVKDDNLTKEDLMERLAKKKMPVGNLLATQIIIRAELDMRLCSGVKKGSKLTYSLFDKRVPPSTKMSKEDSIVKLATTYFNSRGPATIKDFAWWSGMSVGDAKVGVGGQGKTLKSATVGGLQYFYFDTNIEYAKKKTSALLPAFDEYMVGYSEGRDIAFPEGFDKTSVGNGIFKALILEDNIVSGTWKRTKKEPFVNTQFFDRKSGARLKGAIDRFRRFQTNPK